jgi:hypothetical protein
VPGNLGLRVSQQASGGRFGGMAAALNLFIPLPVPLIVIGVAAAIFALQVWSSYELIRNIFRRRALFAYIGSALLANLDLLRGALVRRSSSRVTFSPFSSRSSARACQLICTRGNQTPRWKRRSSRVAPGCRSVGARRGYELSQSRKGILTGMLFSNDIIYFISFRLEPRCTRPVRRISKLRRMSLNHCGGGRRGRHPVRAWNHLWWDSWPSRSPDYPWQLVIASSLAK